LPVYVAVDAGYKHDATAIAVVYYNEKYERVELVFHRIFQPTPEQPLDFEATVERTLLDLGKNKFYVKKDRIRSIPVAGDDAAYGQGGITLRGVSANIATAHVRCAKFL
jgi:hypothetical protein